VTKLPVISGRDCIRALEKAGFHVSHQTGSHIIMRKDDPYAKTVVPNHRELDRGTLRSIIRQAGISVDELVELLK
jgi:predicted RNA binding protein YcfA (HicA-like mRNA interferase family)